MREAFLSGKVPKLSDLVTQEEIFIVVDELKNYVIFSKKNDVLILR